MRRCRRGGGEGREGVCNGQKHLEIVERETQVELLNFDL